MKNNRIELLYLICFMKHIPKYFKKKIVDIFNNNRRKQKKEMTIIHDVISPKGSILVVDYALKNGWH